MLALLGDGTVEQGGTAGASWTRLAAPGAIASSAAGRQCHVTSLTAVAYAPSGTPLAAASCARPGIAGIFARSGNTWQAAGPVLGGALAARQVTVLRLTGTAAGDLALLQARAGERRQPARRLDERRNPVDGLSPAGCRYRASGRLRHRVRRRGLGAAGRWPRVRRFRPWQRLAAAAVATAGNRRPGGWAWRRVRGAGRGQRKANRLPAVPGRCLEQAPDSLGPDPVRLLLVRPSAAPRCPRSLVVDVTSTTLFGSRCHIDHVPGCGLMGAWRGAADGRARGCAADVVLPAGGAGAGDPQEAAAAARPEGRRDRRVGRLRAGAHRAGPDRARRDAPDPDHGLVGAAVPRRASRRHGHRAGHRAEHPVRADRQRHRALDRPGPAGHDRAAPPVLRGHRAAPDARRLAARRGLAARGGAAPGAVLLRRRRRPRLPARRRRHRHAGAGSPAGSPAP